MTDSAAGLSPDSKGERIARASGGVVAPVAA